MDDERVAAAQRVISEDEQRKRKLPFDEPPSKGLTFSSVSAAMTSHSDSKRARSPTAADDARGDAAPKRTHADREDDSSAYKPESEESEEEEEEDDEHAPDEDAAEAAKTATAKPDAPPIVLPKPMASKWSGGEEGAGRKSERSKKRPKRSEKDEEASIDVVHHGKGKKKGAAAATEGAIYKALTMAQIRAENFRLNHGIVIRENEEIDLEDTSCEDSDQDCGGRFGADADEDEHSVRRKMYSNGNFDDDDDDDGDEGGDTEFRREVDRLGFGELADQVEKKIRVNRVAKKHKRAAGHSKVASKMGRMNNCFLCKFGKSTDSSVDSEHVQKLRSFLFVNVGEKPMEYIAMAMHAYYKSVIRPAGGIDGKPLPQMRSKDFFVCITTHNQIPEIKLARDLATFETMQHLLERKIAVSAAGTEDQVPVRQLMKELRETTATKWRLFGLPMARMNFHRSERDIKLGSDRMYFQGLKLQRNDAKAGSALAAGAPKLK